MVVAACHHLQIESYRRHQQAFSLRPYFALAILRGVVGNNKKMEMGNFLANQKQV